MAVIYSHDNAFRKRPISMERTCMLVKYTNDCGRYRDCAGQCHMKITCLESKAAGTGQAAQAKTGPLFRPFDMVMVVKCGNGRPILHAIRSN